MSTPWRDRSGKVSALKTVTFTALLVPGVVNFVYDELGLLGARPITELIHASGLWAIRLLFLSLAITPLRQMLRLPQLITLRRMIGVSAFVYAALHLALDAADKMFDLATVAAEIALRIYLTIGAAALLLLLALAATSTDGMVRRLGAKRWQALQRGVYAIAVLAVTHFFLQSKIDVTEPIVMAGLLLWLIGYRAISSYGGTELAASPASLVGLSLAAGLLTAAGEALYFGLFTGVDATRVLQADVTFAAGPRPAWTVLAIGLGATAAAMARSLWERRDTGARNA